MKILLGLLFVTACATNAPLVKEKSFLLMCKDLMAPIACLKGSSADSDGNITCVLPQDTIILTRNQCIIQQIGKIKPIKE